MFAGRIARGYSRRLHSSSIALAWYTGARWAACVRPRPQQTRGAFAMRRILLVASVLCLVVLLTVLTVAPAFACGGIGLPC